jgi:hypothetical protein
MNMAEPLEFQIVQNLQTALRSISIASGYHHDFESLAVKLDANHDVEELIGDQPLRPFIILELRPNIFDYSEASAGYVLVLIPFIVHAVNDTDPKVDDDMLKKYLRLCADVEQAIAVDERRGGLATDTRIFERSLHELDGQRVWALLSGQVREHRKYGEPNG